MSDSSWLWVVFTIIAAAAQTVRNAAQRELTGTLGTVGATHVRFLFGCPFAILILMGVLASGAALHLVWKEFDGTKAVVRWQVSHDGGRQWTEARTVADTEDASDHPILVADRQRVYLSWLTKIEGYRLIALEDQP